MGNPDGAGGGDVRCGWLVMGVFDNLGVEVNGSMDDVVEWIGLPWVGREARVFLAVTRMIGDLAAAVNPAGTQPLSGWGFFLGGPRVGLRGEGLPWALGRNPVGIVGRCAW